MSQAGGTNLRGRYAVFGEIAAGGMATVHLGRLVGPVGFARTVAIKKLHAQFAKDPDFVAMFLDEARLAARIRHPNVVQTVDVVNEGDEVFLVMDYVQGETLSRVMRELRPKNERVPPAIAASIMTATLQGLHAAHEAKTERGKALGIVHRDVSPQNIMIGTDGVTRVLDFGVAKAAWRAQTTREGQIKGKLSYMAPEQLINQEIDRRVDIYAAGVVLWEALTGKRLVSGDNPGQLTMEILEKAPEPPSKYASDVPPALDALVVKALAKQKEDRFQNARDMCVELERASRVATAREVGEWLESVVGEVLQSRAVRVAEIESQTSHSNSRPPPPSFPDLNDAEGHGQLGSVSSATLTAPIVTTTSVAGVPKPLKKPKKIAFGVGAGVLGVAAIIGVLAWMKPAIPTPATSASHPPPVETTPPAITATATPPVTATAAIPATATATATATASATTTPIATAVAKPTVKPTAVPVAPKPGGCDPPYTVDAKGIKVPKPQCF